MMIKKEMLVGLTTEGSFVFMEVGHNGNYFAISTSEVIPTLFSEEEKLSYIDDMVNDYDTDIKWDMLERFNCKPSELAENLLDEEVFTEWLDCSLTPNHLYHLIEEEINGRELYLESGSCGQYDSFEIVKHFMNKDDLQYLMEVWREHHLSTELPTDVENRINKIFTDYDNKYSEQSEEVFIREEINKII